MMNRDMKQLYADILKRGWSIKVWHKPEDNIYLVKTFNSRGPLITNDNNYYKLQPKFILSLWPEVVNEIIKKIKNIEGDPPSLI